MNNLDDIAAKLPRIEFRERKKKSEYYNQPMQSLRGGRQFILRTSPVYSDNKITLTLIEHGERVGEVFTIAQRTAIFNEPEAVQKALKSLERKAGCKLYYRLLISTDGEYL